MVSINCGNFNKKCKIEHNKFNCINYAVKKTERSNRMINNIIDNLEGSLNNFVQKSVVINQNGFIESVYLIKKLKYSIKYDILHIIDAESINYIKININQIYKIENGKESLIFYLDNDANIILNIKR